MDTEENLIYVAGLLDGEGCFSIYNNRKIVISCSNTDKNIIYWLKENFGGSICSNSTRLRKENHRRVYSWSIVANQARDFIHLVLPYLKIKHKQAIGLLCFQQTITKGGKRLSKEVLEERDRISLKVKELKRVKYA